MSVWLECCVNCAVLHFAPDSIKGWMLRVPSNRIAGLCRQAVIVLHFVPDFSGARNWIDIYYTFLHYVPDYSGARDWIE